MLTKRNPEAEAQSLENLRQRVEQERKLIRARLAVPPKQKSKRNARANSRGKLRQIFRQFEGLNDN
jgi:hypothetical protein